MDDRPDLIRAPLIDTHAHLDSDHYQGDLEAVISRARRFGLLSIVTVGFEPSGWPATLSIAERYSDIYPALGIHPNSADQTTNSTMAELERLCRAGDGKRSWAWGNRPRLLPRVRFPRRPARLFSQAPRAGALPRPAGHHP